MGYDMHHIDELGNNVIGEIGEVMACRLIPYAHRTKGKTRGFLDQELPFEIPDYIKTFLKKYWRSIDLFRFRSGEKFYCEFIEVKTYSKPKWIDKYEGVKLTSNTMRIYKEARQLGIITKICYIYFYPNWTFSYSFKDLEFRKCYVNKGGSQTAYFRKEIHVDTIL